MASSGTSSRIKVQKHRERLRKQGLRPIQIWVPDVRSAAFRSEAHRQSAAIAASAHAADDQGFVDAVAGNPNRETTGVVLSDFRSRRCSLTNSACLLFFPH